MHPPNFLKNQAHFHHIYLYIFLRPNWTFPHTESLTYIFKKSGTFPHTESLTQGTCRVFISLRHLDPNVSYIRNLDERDSYLYFEWKGLLPVLAFGCFSACERTLDVYIYFANGWLSWVRPTICYSITNFFLRFKKNLVL